MPKIRVLVVDDSVVMRRMITGVLENHPEIEVIGAVSNGKIALQKLPQVCPDLITLDVEMPEMDGLETLRHIRQSHPKLPVIMFSTLTEKGAVTTLDALALGASDYVAKPANMGSAAEGLQRLEQELVPKILAHCRHLITEKTKPAVVKEFISALPRSTTKKPESKKIELLCIGTSTGGPTALNEVFRHFPTDFPVPIVVVQHMPAMFTLFLAQRLALVAKIPVAEGIHGETLQPGRAYIAPGGLHMEVVREARGMTIKLHDGPLENSCRPAVDVLFRSAAEAYHDSILAVILTGMGSDGLRGCQKIADKGGEIFVQDEASSVVWGMPGAVKEANLADQMYPLATVGPEIVKRIQNGALIRK